MELSKYEQETVVNYNAEETVSIIYTRDRAVMDVLDTLVNVDPEHYKLKGYTDIDRTYEMPKSYVSYRKPRRLKPAQREAARARMKRINSNRSGL